MERRPNSRANLDRAIQRLYGTQTSFVEIRSMIANTVVGQFLPDGVVKGGNALRLRFGLDATRMHETISTIRGMDLVYVDLYCVKTIEEFCRRVVSAFSALDRHTGFLRRTAQLIANLRPVLALSQ